ncbi:S-layer homology domain-containing protein [Cohnella endophytica]|uniref:S-layer homology domain-containing protein n=1 Tax=Cohnella endophytica TaxID=2419778 RepID=A0A494XVE9_9BACL|nr:S-layer homology domain-containing protein [Cohnella endophytica]RKP51563.1 S-layer homology domain-containing protein [Cohnella endophytica]
MRYLPLLNRRNIVLAAFVLALLLTKSMVFGANEIMNQQKADTLKAMRLFQGTNDGYELDKAFTRAQGSVMLIRLLGWEDKAKTAGGKPAFTDVKKSHWAAAFIAYANSKGLVRGISNSQFAPEETMSGAQFIALTLRALGYSQAEPANAMELAVKSGLLDGKDAKLLTEKKPFLRDDMVAVAYGALTTKMNNSDKTLLQKLVEDDRSVNKQSALDSGLYKEKTTEPLRSNDPLDQIEYAIRKALNP